MSTPAPERSLEEIVALALNEQGFLFQHRVEALLLEKNANGKFLHQWLVHVDECPVQWGDDETRVDLVLENASYPGRGWYIAVECKRANREFKSWVFFGREGGLGRDHRRYYFFHDGGEENGLVSAKKTTVEHRIQRRTILPDSRLFRYYVESRQNSPSRQNSASATSAIESAFEQAVLGQAGLARRLLALKQTPFHVAAVVVTTARVLCADYKTESVSRVSGTIESKDLTITDVPWVAVNYPIRPSLSDGFPAPQSENINLRDYLATQQLRTVFVVQSDRLNEFLRWFEQFAIG